MAVHFYILVTLVLAIVQAVGGYHVHNQESGCAKSHDWAGTTREFQFDHEGRRRSYRVHLPKDYTEQGPLPLLVAYHGRGDNATNFERTTRFSEADLNPGMIVAYPQGVNQSWEGPTYAVPGVNDKSFTESLVRHLQANYCIDSHRIYAAGHSNGGGFVGTLACSREGGLFAAFAPVAGAFYTDANGSSDCQPSRNLLPILEIHGGNDTTIPYTPIGPGAGGPLPAINDWLERWSIRNGCNKRSVVDVAQGVEKMLWKCRDQKEALQHYKLAKHDHSWPVASSGLDASRSVLAFLGSQKKAF